MSRLDRIVFDADITPPTVPVLATPTVFDQSRLDLSWTVSIDAQSGLAGYDILIDGTTLIGIGVQTSYSATGFAASSTHTFRVRSRDLAGNVSAYSNQVSGTTAAAPAVYNPTFPRLASYAISGTQNYANAAVIAAMALRHVNIVSHYPGWQQSSTKGNGTSMASVCASVKAQSTIGSKMFPYIIASEVAKANANPGNAYWEVYQYAANNNLFAYTNGANETGPVDGTPGSTIARLNYTTAGKIVNGKNFGQWFLDWCKGVNYSGATVSNGSSNVTAANNPNWDGTFFDNVFYQERSPLADWNRDGTVDTVTSSTSRALTQDSHTALAAYQRTITTGQMVLANSADWWVLGAGFSATSLNQAFDGGVIESGIGRSGCPETSQSFQVYINSIKTQMDGYLPPKLGVIVNQLPSYTDYRNMRYSLGACLMTDAYCYQASGGSNPSQDLPTTWYDEYAFTLGAPIDSVQTAPRYNIEAGGTGGGVWRRDFVNGIVLVGGRRGNGALASFDQETAYASVTLGGTFYRLAGTQDPATNNGASLTTIALKPRDAIVLRRIPADVVAPSAPGSLSASPISATQINLTWNASTDAGSGVAGYQLERALAAAGPFTQIIQQSTTTYPDIGLTAGTTYFYRVRAIDNALNLSAYSNTTSASTLGGPVWASGTITYSLTVGVAFSLNLNSICTGAVSFSVLDALPAGLSLDGTTGIITGTPTTSGSLTTNFRASDAAATGIVVPAWANSPVL